ncbi:MAG: prepilin-type N-terminal cleavage/methylation domain-containing protein [Cyanobacteria bacterium P01_F01_bin.42]
MFYRRRRIQGFTLIESLIIIAVLAVFAAIAAPSFGNLLDGIRLNQTVTEARLVLSNAQRQAIRKRDVCRADISTNEYSTGRGKSYATSSFFSNCAPSEESNFSQKVIVATNVLPNSFSSSSVGASSTSSNMQPLNLLRNLYGSSGWNSELLGSSGTDWLIAADDLSDDDESDSNDDLFDDDDDDGDEANNSRSSNNSNANSRNSGSSGSSTVGDIIDDAIDEGTRIWCRDHAGHDHDDYDERCSRPSSSSSSGDPKIAQVAFGKSGNILFNIRSSIRVPDDPSGKLVLYTRDKEERTQKCIVISRRLGLTRVGSYRGELGQEDITKGRCTATDWKTQ